MACWQRAEVLRYGENPHQRAALYVSDPPAPGLATAELLHGKAMSYNNYVDADAAWRAAHDFTEPAVAIIKHANPCGIAVGADVAEAHRKANDCDPISAYGGVIATNRPVDRGVGPADRRGVHRGRRRAGVRRRRPRAAAGQEESAAAGGTAGPRRGGVELRPISGGVLLQSADAIDADGDDPADWTLATGEPADAATLADLAFAWRAVRSVKSNAILLADGGATVGVGMGQVNRVDAARLAVARAGEDRARARSPPPTRSSRSPTACEVLLEAGVRAVVQPGGSMRDDEVSRGRERGGRHDVLHRHPSLHALMSVPRTTPLAGHRGEIIALAALAAGLGALSSLQGHWNAQMADLLHDPREAALLSLGTGLVILSVLVAVRADLRSGLARGVSAYRSGELVWWQLLGGLGGAAFIAGQSIVVPRVGVALFTVAVVGAQTANSLFVDRAGLGPSGHRRRAA